MNNVISFKQPEHSVSVDPELKNDEAFQALINQPLPLQMLRQDIEEHMGSGFLDKIPREIFEGFCLKSIDRNEPTGLMLQVLVQNFMKAYLDPEKVEKAMEAFDFLTYLNLQDEELADLEDDQ